MKSSEISYAIFLLFIVIFFYSKLIEEKSSQNKIKNVIKRIIEPSSINTTQQFAIFPIKISLKLIQYGVSLRFHLMVIHSPI